MKKVEALLAGDQDVATYTDLRRAGSPRFYLGAQSGAAEPGLRPVRHRDQGPRGARARQGAAREGDRRRRASRGVGARDRFELGPPVGFPVQFRVVGPDPKKVRAIAERRAQGDGGEPQGRRRAARLERAGRSRSGSRSTRTGRARSASRRRTSRRPADADERATVTQ